MRKRFPIFFTLYVAILWAAGVAVARRDAPRGWNFLPQSFQVYVLRGRDGGPVEFFPLDSRFDSVYDDPDFSPEMNTRFMGTVSVILGVDYGVSGPFLRYTRRSAFGLHDPHYGWFEELQPEDIAEAEYLAIREARLAFGTDFLTTESVRFAMDVHPIQTNVEPTYSLSIEPMMPWRSLILLFTFLPALLAWASTAASLHLVRRGVTHRRRG